MNENITLLCEMLDNMAPKAYLLKTLCNNQIKVQLEYSVEYLATTEALKKVVAAIYWPLKNTIKNQHTQFFKTLRNRFTLGG